MGLVIQVGHKMVDNIPKVFVVVVLPAEKMEAGLQKRWKMKQYPA